MAANGVPGSYMEAIMAGSYKEHPEYVHYQSVKFRIALCFSDVFFHYLLQRKVWPMYRSWCVPNTPVGLPRELYWAPRRHHMGGPDEDFYISIEEGDWF